MEAKQVTMSTSDVERSALGRLVRAPVLRSAWAQVVQWQFRLFQRHRHQNLVLEEVAGRPILVLPEVFNPKLFQTGAFLAETLDDRLIPRGADVLDMGTGSGIGAVFAATWAERVVAVDINAEAVRCARINALLNRVDGRVEVRHGDLFAPVAGERFDVVLFNPPFFRGTPKGAFDYAWRSNDTVERFAAGLSRHLLPDGHALVILSSVSDTPTFLRAFRDNGLTVEPLVERDFFVETFAIYRLRRQEDDRGA